MTPVKMYLEKNVCL